MTVVNYRAYPAALATRPVELLKDVDEYFQDVATTLAATQSPRIFITSWILRPQIMIAPGKTLESALVTALKQPDAVCYILWNSHVSGLSGRAVAKDATDFVARVKKALPGSAKVEDKLKIIVSANTEFDLSWKLDLALDRKVQGAQTLEQLLEELWLKDFPPPNETFRNLRTLTFSTHHQKTITIAGTVNGQPSLTSYTGGMDFSTGPAGARSVTHAHNGGTWWHDYAIRVRNDGALGVLENFVDRWNDEVDDLDEVFAINVTEDDELDADDVFPEVDDDLEDDIETDLTLPGTTDIRARYETLIGDAEEHIFIENQYVRHRGLAGALLEQLEDEAALIVTIVMPIYPEEITNIRGDLPSLRHRYAAASTQAARDALMDVIKAKSLSVDPVNKLTLMLQSECLKDLVAHPRVRIWITSRVSGTGKNLKVAVSPYIHTKMMVVDGKAITVGSANFNGRSMDGESDTEINVTFTREADGDPAVPDVDQIRNDARFRWMPGPVDEKASDYPGSYYDRHNLVRYTVRHWEVDRELGRFPIGRKDILAYVEAVKKAGIVDKKLMSNLTSTRVNALLDAVGGMPGVNVETDDLGRTLMELIENLL